MNRTEKLVDCLRATGALDITNTSGDEFSASFSVYGRAQEGWPEVLELLLMAERASGYQVLFVGRTYFLDGDALKWSWLISMAGLPAEQEQFLTHLEAYVDQYALAAEEPEPAPPPPPPVYAPKRRGLVEVTEQPLHTRLSFATVRPVLGSSESNPVAWNGNKE